MSSSEKQVEELQRENAGKKQKLLLKNKHCMFLCITKKREKRSERYMSEKQIQHIDEIFCGCLSAVNLLFLFVADLLARVTARENKSTGRITK